MDIEPFYRNRAGVGRYVQGILGGLTRLEEPDAYTLFRSASYAEAESVPGLVRDRVTDVTLPLSHKGCRLRWLLLDRPRVERYIGMHDLFFAPCPPAFPTSGKLVVAVLDLVWMRYPQFFPRRANWMRRIDHRRVLRRCAGVLTISESSRRDIVEMLGFREDRVRVVYLGVEPRLREIPSDDEIAETLERLNVRTPYVLTVAGDNGPKKNLPNLVRAMATLPTDLKEVHLVNVGRPRYDLSGVTTLIERCGMTGRVQFLGRVEDEDLRRLYAGARLTAYPSFYEGFGFPIVESMALGTPVVTSNVSSMPEVAGDAALLVDPGDPEGIAGAITSIVGDDALHAELRRKGFERVRRFDWQQSARQTRDYFAELADD